MPASGDAASLSPDLELELFSPFSENTESHPTVHDLLESLNNSGRSRVDEENQVLNETAVANHSTDGEILTTEMATLSLQESYHITFHASLTNSSLLPAIENEDIMEDLRYYSFQDISYHDGHYTTSMSSFDIRTINLSTDFSPMVQCNSSDPSFLHHDPAIVSVNYDASSSWMANLPASYCPSSSLSFSDDSGSSFSCSSSRDFSSFEGSISENMDYMDVDDPSLQIWANNSTSKYQHQTLLNSRSQKRRHRSQRGSLCSLSSPRTTLSKLKASSRPYRIFNRAQRHRHRRKLRPISQEHI